MKLRIAKKDQVIEKVNELLENKEVNTCVSLIKFVQGSDNVVWELQVCVMGREDNPYPAFVIQGMPSGKNYVIRLQDMTKMIMLFGNLIDSKKAIETIKEIVYTFEKNVKKKGSFKTIEVEEYEDEEFVRKKQ